MKRNSFWLASTFVLLASFGSTAHATLSIVSSVGGHASNAIGTNYVTFDQGTYTYDGTDGFNPFNVHYTFKNTLGAAAITATLTPDAQLVLNGQSVSGQYATPVLSNLNYQHFYNSPTVGPNATNYLTSGKDNSPTTNAGAQVILEFAPSKYFGLLWGSIDGNSSINNILEFYDGNTLVGTITGAQVTATPNGDQGASGTRYVNINSTVDFTKVVMTSTEHAFEFDDVAFSAGAFSESVPEPASLLIWSLLGLAGVVAYRRRRKAA